MKLVQRACASANSALKASSLPFDFPTILHSPVTSSRMSVHRGAKTLSKSYFRVNSRLFLLDY